MTQHIYLVEDVGNSPGKIYACFASEVDAHTFADYMNSFGTTDTEVEVVERTLYYGQPPRGGYNP